MDTYGSSVYPKEYNRYGLPKIISPIDTSIFYSFDTILSHLLILGDRYKLHNLLNAIAFSLSLRGSDMEEILFYTLLHQISPETKNYILCYKFTKRCYFGTETTLSPNLENQLDNLKKM